MKTGLFFGSFNPIHTGHLIIANHIANFFTDEVWFIVSPQNPFKSREDLLDAGERFELAKLATQEDARFKVSDIEFRLPTPSYTINTLTELSKQYKEYEFLLVIGSDNLAGFPGWKSSEAIINAYKMLVFERPGFPINKTTLHPNVQVITPELLDISATAVRELITEGKSIRYLVPEAVRTRIEKDHYYK